MIAFDATAGNRHFMTSHGSFAESKIGYPLRFGELCVQDIFDNLAKFKPENVRKLTVAANELKDSTFCGNCAHVYLDWGRSFKRPDPRPRTISRVCV